MSASHQPLILYDGQCGLCHRSVKWLLRRDGGRIWYAPLQGETAAGLRARYPIPTTLESVVLIDGDRMFVRSKAFLYASKHLGRPWRSAYYLRWLPAFVLDLGYRLIAATRYRLFGHFETCSIPTAAQRDKLLP